MSNAGILTDGLGAVASETTFVLLCLGILKVAKDFLAVVASGSLSGVLGFSVLSLCFALGEVEVAAKCGSMIGGPLGLALGSLVTLPTFSMAGRLVTMVPLTLVYFALLV